MQEHELFNFELPLDQLIVNLRKGLMKMTAEGGFSKEDFASAEDFISFVYPIVHDGPMTVLKNMGGIMNGTPLPEEAKSFDECWDYCVPYWPAAETPVNYALTMMVLHKFVREIPNAKRILSLGSGPGLYETFLAKKFPGLTITSMDSSSKMVEQHRKYVQKHASNQVVDHGDMAELPYDSGYFSGVICNNSLQWVKPAFVQRSVREMYRVAQRLAPVGLLLHPYPMTMLARYGGSKEMAPIFRGMDAAEILDICKGQGFISQNAVILSGEGTGQAGNHTRRIALSLQKQKI